MSKIIPTLSQQNFPKTYLLFQELIGGVSDKKKLLMEYYEGQKSILEIGCSVGNLADTFKPLQGIKYTGVDIDAGALKLAKKRFAKQSNFSFLNIDLIDLAESGQKFDYILFAGILHHVNDATALKLLKMVSKIITLDGVIVFSEVEKLRRDDNLFFKLFYNFEQGKYLRTAEELAALVRKGNIKVVETNERLVAPNAVGWPKVARFTLIKGKPTISI